ncbi:sulfate transporter family-domain-containing protein [Microdochium bolleyi]|uniref:Sulfate transporter family-domain-containing protein n=1 Tax=Microdochium bolleyi TaxID=196109 RepID=A0A136ILP7_9PEZI|nr:sulfate transporter family-domain-containing protein [Microdochium bolleyi]
MAGHDNTSQRLLAGHASEYGQSYGSFGSASTHTEHSRAGSSSAAPTARNINHNQKSDFSDYNNDDNDSYDRNFSTRTDLEMNYPLEKHPWFTSTPTVTTSHNNATTPITEVITSLVPGISWIRSYRTAHVLPDLMGALTVASLYIPLAFSFASVAGVPPASSLYAFVFHPPVYALLGTCPLMVIGPEATGSLLVGAAIHALNPGSGTTTVGEDGEDSAATTNALIAGAATALAGAILLTMGFLRLGFLDNVLSRPLMKGFICGVGVVLVVKQTVPGLGLQHVLAEAADRGTAGDDGSSSAGREASALEILLSLLGNVAQLDVLAAAFSVCTLGFVLACAHIKKKYAKHFPSIVYFPDRFVAIVASAVVVYALDLEAHGLDIVGASGSSRPGLPSFNASLVTDFDRLKSVANTALMIALLGYFESSVTGKSMRRPPAPPTTTEDNSSPDPVVSNGKDKADYSSPPRKSDADQLQPRQRQARQQKQKQKQQQLQHSADRELVALGTANVLGGLFSTLPAFGGFGRSKLNLQAGSQTPMSGIFLSLITFLAILFVTPLLYYVPRATLAAMSCAVGIAMVEECAHDVVFFVKARGWREVLLMGVVSGVIFVKGMSVGVVVGLGIAVGLVVKEASAVSATAIAVAGDVDGRAERRGGPGHGRLVASGITTERPTRQHPSDHHTDRIVRLRVQESLTFVNAAALVALIDQAFGTADGTALVLDLQQVTRIDACCGQLLVEAIQRHASGGRVTAVVICDPESESVLRSLKRCGLLDIGAAVRVASDQEEAGLVLADLALDERGCRP